MVFVIWSVTASFDVVNHFLGNSFHFNMSITVVRVASTSWPYIFAIFSVLSLRVHSTSKLVRSTHAKSKPVSLHRTKQRIHQLYTSQHDHAVSICAHNLWLTRGCGAHIPKSNLLSRDDRSVFEIFVENFSGSIF